MQAQVRGRDIGFIPQDPFQALNPVFRIETQLMEQLATHGVAGRRAAPTAAPCAPISSRC